MESIKHIRIKTFMFSFRKGEYYLLRETKSLSGWENVKDMRRGIFYRMTEAKKHATERIENGLIVHEKFYSFLLKRYIPWYQVITLEKENSHEGTEKLAGHKT